MTIPELRELLQNDDVIRAQSFKLLKEMALLYNTEHEDVCREMVCRALERRESFAPFTNILDDIVRQLGLFPYLQNQDALSLMDSIAYEFHRPANSEESLVFHREQAEIYRRLIRGENIILSAPTSFGKSKVIDALIASGKYNNIVLVVPTIALIDETRRRLAPFSREYKIVTQVSQSPGGKNVFVFTAERANVYQNFPTIDNKALRALLTVSKLAEHQKTKCQGARE